MKLRLRGSPFYYDFDLKPDADNAAVGKYVSSIATGKIACGFSVFRRQKALSFLGLQVKISKEKEKMKETNKKQIYNLTLSAVFIALATVLSMIKIYKLPLGGSVTLLSMLPIVMLSCMLGVKWGLGSAFVYSLIQLGLGIALDGLLGWGLTPWSLIGTIALDYIVPFTLLGLAGIAAKKGIGFITLGTAAVLALRFISHFLSGYIIFANFEKFVVFGENYVSRPALYSLCYNGSYMLPELIITVVAVLLLMKLPQIKKLINA